MNLKVPIKRQASKNSKSIAKINPNVRNPGKQLKELSTLQDSIQDPHAFRKGQSQAHKIVMDDLDFLDDQEADEYMIMFDSFRKQ